MSGGIKYDGEKPNMALIPPNALEQEARVWTFGSKKYDSWNWSKGFKYTRVLSALQRHTLQILKGEMLDSESGLPHAAHIRCCAAMLIEFEANGRGPELNDLLYKPEHGTVKEEVQHIQEVEQVEVVKKTRRPKKPLIRR